MGASGASSAQVARSRTFGRESASAAAIDSIRKRHRDRRVKDSRNAPFGLEDASMCAPRPARARAAWLTAGPLAWPVALGRGGILANKREGDGATPRGTFRLLRLWWRADREPAAGDPAAGAADRRGRRLVRGPGGPPLQPADQARRRRAAATGCGATTISMISLSKSTTTPARGWPAAAARCSSIWRGRVLRRPPAASRCPRPRLRRLLEKSDPRPGSSSVRQIL